MNTISNLQRDRYNYVPKLPQELQGAMDQICLVNGEATTSYADHEQIAQLFPAGYGKPVVSFARGSASANVGKTLNVGVILSGGQAPGGHNVIAGLFDGLKKANGQSRLFGFLGGPSGLLEGQTKEITAELLAEYRNTGGFDMIQSGRTKLESEAQFDVALANCRALNLQALVVVGGDDSNTNAAVLAEYFLSKNAGVQVIGCPKTIDGDLKNAFIETSFGFDTACKTYSELIGNIARDANSARKYWHFIKLMGRSASHIALECALQTQPNVCLISEEIEAKKMTLAQVVTTIARSVEDRAKKGMNYGIVLIPEGLIEFIPEIKVLIDELNDLLSVRAQEFSSYSTTQARLDWLLKILTPVSSQVYESLPSTIQAQLIMDRDPHGNVQVSLIETEKLLGEMVYTHLVRQAEEGHYVGKFTFLGHFFGYEGRCAFPSNFDADYCYGLGYTAFLLIANGLTGYISSLRNLHLPAAQWTAVGLPLTLMMNMEKRHGHLKPVIKKALVELDGVPFVYFKKHRDEWAVENSYIFPGAIQYYGPAEVCDFPTKTLLLEKK